MLRRTEDEIGGTRTRKGKVNLKPRVLHLVFALVLIHSICSRTLSVVWIFMPHCGVVEMKKRRTPATAVTALPPEMAGAWSGLGLGKDGLGAEAPLMAAAASCAACAGTSPAPASLVELSAAAGGFATLKPGRLAPPAEGSSCPFLVGASMLTEGADALVRSGSARCSTEAEETGEGEAGPRWALSGLPPPGRTRIATTVASCYCQFVRTDPLCVCGRVLLRNFELIYESDLSLVVVMRRSRRECYRSSRTRWSLRNGNR